MNDEDFKALPTVKPKPSLRYSELARIHHERQSAIISTLLVECPDPIPEHCRKLIDNAPESFDDLRYGHVANAIKHLRSVRKPVSILTVQEEVARNPAPVDLSEIFKFLALQPQPLSQTMLEWECEELWNAYNFRRQATLFNDASASIVAHPDRAVAISEHVRRCIDDLTRNGHSLPDMVDSFDFMASEMENPPEVVAGILHQGSKMALGGGSKSFKTWTLLDLALSVASGSEWMGFPTTSGPVLYINFEIQDYAWHKRIEAVSNAKGIHIKRGMLQLWNLRGSASDFNILLPKIIQRSKREGFSLTILDPIYKLYGKTDENSASDVAALMNGIEELNVETKSSTAFGAHFAKGNSSQKEAIDRISGSGVFARDPDSLLMFTPHEEPNCFTIEPILRNFKPIDPFTVQWKFPLMSRNELLDPTRLKKSNGRPKEYTINAILKAIESNTDSNPTTLSRWSLAAGIPRNSMSPYVHELRNRGFIATVGDGSSSKQCITPSGVAFLSTLP